MAEEALAASPADGLEDHSKPSAKTASPAAAPCAGLVVTRGAVRGRTRDLTGQGDRVAVLRERRLGTHREVAATQGERRARTGRDQISRLRRESGAAPARRRCDARGAAAAQPREGEGQLRVLGRVRARIVHRHLVLGARRGRHRRGQGTHAHRQIRRAETGRAEVGDDRIMVGDTPPGGRRSEVGYGEI